ncbi:hypothetical protein Tco_0750839 [Tanacetum coccineum]|uniref:Uncharacterized protein n=1 Tax=Tanacetum coccineum TaxID=301880 RepID=A0ABQ4Z2A4_9ASTR
MPRSGEGLVFRSGGLLFSIASYESSCYFLRVQMKRNEENHRLKASPPSPQEPVSPPNFVSFILPSFPEILPNDFNGFQSLIVSTGSSLLVYASDLTIHEECWCCGSEEGNYPIILCPGCSMRGSLGKSPQLVANKHRILLFFSKQKSVLTLLRQHARKHAVSILLSVISHWILHIISPA